MAKPKVTVLVGSLRAASLSRKIAMQIIARSQQFECTLPEIGDLPLYNEDLERSVPAQWSRLRSSVGAADAILFVTPEYNRSIPGALKNALDVASRPYGSNAFAGKPAAIVSQSPSRIGGFGANHALRQCCVFLDMPLLQQPEVYLGQSAEALDTEGKIRSAEVSKLLDAFIAAFGEWMRVVQSKGHPH